MPLTREDLHMGLHRFATKHDLDRFATRQDVADLRETTAHGFQDIRRQLDLVARDLMAIAVLLDRLAARNESEGPPPSAGLSDSDEPPQGLDQWSRSD